MGLEDTMTKNNTQKVKVVNPAAPFGGMYFLSFIGAAVHFVDQSAGFWEFILAILKALVWPAFLINQVFDLLRI
jgi:hypothetical protein